MTVKFLHDRYLKSDLERSLPKVAETLRSRWSVMMDNSRETVAWVGIAQAESEGAYFFLPHGAPECELEQAEFAKLVMRAIVRFAREKARDGETRDLESATQAALLAELAADFRDHGLFSTRERLNSRRDGKPDWARTVKSEMAFPSANGAPIYCEISSTRYSSMATNTVAQIQAQIVSEIYRRHSWWLQPYFGARDVPDAESSLAWPREAWPSLLRSARRDLFQSRAIRLVGMLLDYLENASETGTGKVVCGISDFSSLWEVMLRETIDDVELQWNSWLPVPSYFRGNGTRDATHPMELDIVARSGEFVAILDAKYYRASSRTLAPGVQDISKQFVYQKAVESTGKVSPDQIVNAFVFPAEVTGREPFRKIEFVLPTGANAPGFSPVLCQYVSMSDVVSAYVGRRKMAHQDWLAELCVSNQTV